MTRRAIDSQATAKAMIEHYARIGAVVVEERDAQERLRKEVERSGPRMVLLGFTATGYGPQFKKGVSG